ncbi:putative Ribosomal RNA small subunit methyltransferase [Blattamonas nauphoetae]|uniref:rRNA adenine N(6)-methyltransferase n=1 Tax=Blattamonas nauphoetae TaxID=2049346 RepID=A0ABQ9Y4B7_9EUKA|nr:putative Ribosomal RNA small subunit methyltransferase [Blattamonas nauphoetae]
MSYNQSIAQSSTEPSHSPETNSTEYQEQVQDQLIDNIRDNAKRMKTLQLGFSDHIAGDSQLLDDYSDVVTANQAKITRVTDDVTKATEARRKKNCVSFSTLDPMMDGWVFTIINALLQERRVTIVDNGNKMPKVRSKEEKPAFRQGLVLHHSKGQHLLINPHIIDSIVEKAGLRANDVCLEIGPGTGNLTVKLLERCQKVIAVELDPRMVIELQKRVSGTENGKKLQIIQGDILSVDLPSFSIVVANIPYSISSPLIFRLLSIRPLWRAAVLLIQYEFAQRLVAKPGDELYCRLTVNTSLLATTTHCLKVGKGNFRPPPQVDSSVVRIEPRHPQLPVNYLEWDGMTRVCFMRKNKTMGALFKNNNVLEMLEKNYQTFCSLTGKPVATNLPPIKDRVVQMLTESGFIDKRARTFDLDDFIKTTRLIRYRSDEDIIAQGVGFMMSIHQFLIEPEQYVENSDLWEDSGSVQYYIQRQLEKDSEHFSSYIEEWIKSRNNSDTIWQGVLTAVLQCLTNSWVTSDHRCRTLWRNIKPHWATFVVDFKPIIVVSNLYLQGYPSREQCLHWILVKFHKAATTLLEQGIVHKLLVHMDQAESDTSIFSDLKMLFVCLRMSRVRVLHFHVPMLENGLEDMAEMVSFINHDSLSDYARQVLILRPIAAKLIPLMKFSREYRPNVSRRFKEFHSNRRYKSCDACSSDATIPIDVEKTAEKRAIRGQYKEESSSELENNDHYDMSSDDNDISDKNIEMVDEEEEEEEASWSEASEESEEYSNADTEASSSDIEDEESDEQSDEEGVDISGKFLMKKMNHPKRNKT